MNSPTAIGATCLLLMGEALLPFAASCGGDHGSGAPSSDGGGLDVTTPVKDGGTKPVDDGGAGPPTDGACGKSSGLTLGSAPTDQLCAAGIASPVSHNGPWTWTCAGKSGGKAAKCQAGADPCLPFTMPTPDDLFASSHKVLAHDFNFFALSIDNKPANVDYYSTEWLVPYGEEAEAGVPESGAHFWNGGYLRTRPLPVTPSSASDWASGAGETLNVEREIRLALGRGITGFVFEILGMDDVNLSTSSTNDNRLVYAMAAATAVDSRFKLVLMPDVISLSGDNLTATTEAQVISDVTEIVETYYDETKYPALLHAADGRLVVSPYYANGIPASMWQTMEQQLATAGYPIYFVPVFLSLESTYVDDYSSISDGMGDWGTALTGQNTWIPANATAAHATKSAKGVTEIYMAGLSGQDYRPKDFIYEEAEGSAAYTQGWLGTVAGIGTPSQPDWLQLTTWSDFSESTEVEPYTDLTLDRTIGTGYYDLTGYYSTWFLTGKKPAITHDVLYYFYRKESVAAAAAAPNTGCENTTTDTFTRPCPTTNADPGVPGVDTIFLLGFLAQPGTLSIAIGGHTYSSAVLPAGIQTYQVPLAAGTPTFGLSRGGTSVISFTGKVTIAGASGLSTGYPDLTYWSGSASASGTCSISIQ